MTAINILLSVIPITGGLLLGVVLLAFVVAGWINQLPISKQHLARSSGEETLTHDSVIKELTTHYRKFKETT